MTRLLAVAAVLSASCALAACGGSGPELAVTPAGMESIGAGAAADTSDAEDLEAKVDDEVTPDLGSLEPAGPTRQITAERQPRGGARIALSVDEKIPAGQWAAVGVASEPGGPWTFVEAKPTADRLAVTFTAPHFSWFTPVVTDVKAIFSETRKIFDDMTSGAYAEAKDPSCPDEAGARSGGWKIASEGKETLKWCFGRRDGKRILTAVNNRRYHLALRHPGAPTLEPPKVGLIDPARVSPWIDQKLTVLPPRGSVTYEIKQTTLISAKLDGAADSLMALELGVDLASLFLGRIGVKDTKQKVLEVVKQSKDCASAMNLGAGEIIKRCVDYDTLSDAFGARGALSRSL